MSWQEGEMFSKNQFGFCKGKDTISAMEVVRKSAEVARLKNRYCLLVTIDVKNAFNSVRWSEIIRNLEERNYCTYLVELIIDYFKDRYIEYDESGREIVYRMERGVPQGSILGPFFWNCIYDEVLDKEMVEECKIIGFADDVGLVFTGIDVEVIKNRISTEISEIKEILRKKGLAPAGNKTKVITLNNKVIGNKIFRIGNDDFKIKNRTRYLGVIFEKGMRFFEHVDYISKWSVSLIAVLTKIMHNIGGANNKGRMLYYAMWESIVLYWAPIWEEELGFVKNVRRLRTAQRICLCRLARAYRKGSAINLY